MRQDEQGGLSQEKGGILATHLQRREQVNVPIKAPGEHGEVDEPKILSFLTLSLYLH